MARELIWKIFIRVYYNIDIHKGVAIDKTEERSRILSININYRIESQEGNILEYNETETNCCRKYVLSA